MLPVREVSLDVNLILLDPFLAGKKAPFTFLRNCVFLLKSQAFAFCAVGIRYPSQRNMAALARLTCAVMRKPARASL